MVREAAHAALQSFLLLASSPGRYVRRLLLGRCEGETAWEPSVMDPEVEVRWKDGKVESRWVGG